MRKVQIEAAPCPNADEVSHVTAQRFGRSSGDPDRAAAAITERGTALRDGFDDLVDGIADADVVLLGEASHGTSEYYQLRAEISARLLADHGFEFVAVEGDWTDCYDVTEYVTGRSEADGAREVLESFERWPTWMWANWEVVEFVDWLAEYNADRVVGERAGFYGLDVYGLYESMAAVIDYLEDVDSELAAQARDAYHCFEPYGEDAREYARSLRLVPDDCEDEVLAVLRELREEVADRQAASDTAGDDPLADFAAEQNALVASNAEAYYREMGRGGSESWNVRDRHMSETLERLLEFHGGPGIVWAHNTHIGDARATTMEDRGKLNLGQLAREEVCDDDADVAAVGFGSHRGSVIAGDEWGAPMERMRVPEAKAGSIEDGFHRSDLGDAIVRFDRGYATADDADPLAEPRGHRAIGVVYDPDFESGNYVRTVLPDRYDAFVHLEETEALHPLGLEGGETPPETYPWGL